MKKIRIVALFALMICFLGLTELMVMAQEESDGIPVTEMNQIMTVQTDCDARQTPDENSEVMMSYTAGSTVWVIGETENGWYKVSYQGKEGYILIETVTDLQLQTETEQEESVTLTEAGLDTEMAALEAENEMIVEEVERLRAEEKRSQIWKIVIGLLVVGIFVTGIISTMQSKKKKDGSGEGRRAASKSRTDRMEVVDLDADEE